MSVLLQSLLPVSFGATNVANIAVSARVFIDDTGKERLGEFVLEIEVR